MHHYEHVSTLTSYSEMKELSSLPSVEDVFDTFLSYLRIMFQLHIPKSVIGNEYGTLSIKTVQPLMLMQTI